MEKWMGTTGGAHFTMTTRRRGSEGSCTAWHRCPPVHGKGRESGCRERSKCTSIWGGHVHKPNWGSRPGAVGMNCVKMEEAAGGLGGGQKIAPVIGLGGGSFKVTLRAK